MVKQRFVLLLLLSIIELLTIRNIQWPLDMDHVRNNLLSFLKKGTGQFQKIIFICKIRFFRGTDKKNFFLKLQFISVSRIEFVFAKSRFSIQSPV